MRQEFCTVAKSVTRVAIVAMLVAGGARATDSEQGDVGGFFTAVQSDVKLEHAHEFQFLFYPSCTRLTCREHLILDDEHLKQNGGALRWRFNAAMRETVVGTSMLIVRWPGTDSEWLERDSD
ncbi:bacteriocin-protection protein [Sesbania bispinosa]|nr:bacteriocin-protection protein [Sesbania bispinosa]